jgi:hypothetical protein
MEATILRMSFALLLSCLFCPSAFEQAVKSRHTVQTASFPTFFGKPENEKSEAKSL